MKRIIETGIDFIHGDDQILISTARKSYITQIEKWKKQYPDYVNIIHRNDDGSLCVQIPSNWFRFPKPPRKFRKEHDNGNT